MKRTLLLITFLATTCLLHAQYGEISGKILDEREEGITKGTVSIISDSGVVLGPTVYTDFDGNYVIKPLNPGKYNIQVSGAGYKPQVQRGVIVNADKPTWLTARLKKDPAYTVPKTKLKRKK